MWRLRLLKAGGLKLHAFRRLNKELKKKTAKIVEETEKSIVERVVLVCFTPC
jgi:hypothetical protein